MNFSALLRNAFCAHGLRAALVALLLLAQHGALTHALTHAAAHTQDKTAHTDSAHIELPGKGDPAGAVAESCLSDLAYSQLLGGVHAGHAVSFDVAEQVLVVAAAQAVRNSATVVPYDSHGPPAFS